jgi:hypothetical protein
MLHAACTDDTYRLTLTTWTLLTLLQASRIAALPFSVDLASIVLPHRVCIPATHTPRQLSVYSSTQSVPIHSGFIFLESLLRSRDMFYAFRKEYPCPSLHISRQGVNARRQETLHACLKPCHPYADLVGHTIVVHRSPRV